MNVLIIGASRGIGWEFSRQYLDAGASVIATARDAAGVKRLQAIGARTNGGSWLYRASKAAVNSVMKDISFGLQGRAICVAMHPGWVKTDMGGQAADLEVADSVTAMRATIAGLEPKHHASFLNYDGQTLDW